MRETRKSLEDLLCEACQGPGRAPHSVVHPGGAGNRPSCKIQSVVGHPTVDASWCILDAFTRTVLRLIARTLPLVFGETT
jgi:hypothetical protein